jgi:methanogenic corrinoid protein MtbC1
MTQSASTEEGFQVLDEHSLRAQPELAIGDRRPVPKRAPSRPTRKRASGPSQASPSNTLPTVGSLQKTGAHQRDGMVDASREDQLAEMIESQVIPRLMLLNSPGMCIDLQRATPARFDGVSACTVERFAKLLPKQSFEVVQVELQTLLDDGATLEQIYLDLLGPAARVLGERWERDDVDFFEVTLGLLTLQQALRWLGGQIDYPGPFAEGKSVLLMPVPGDQHTFGLLMVSEMFRRSGWEVTGGVPLTIAVVERIVAEKPFPIIGLSLGAVTNASALADLIGTVRRASCDRNTVVLVGGSAFTRDPGLAHKLGADRVARDALEAVRIAEQVITTGSRLQH